MKLAKNLFFSMIADWLKDYIPHKSKTAKTAEAYSKAMAIFRRYVCNVKHVSMRTFKFRDCSFEFLLDYRNWLMDEKKYKPATVNHRLTVVKAYYKYAAARDPALAQAYLGLTEVPNAPNPITIRELIEDHNDLKALLHAPHNHTKCERRDKLILGILYDTAIRAEELVKLSLRDVHIKLEQPYLNIDGKGARQRMVPITSNMLPLVEDYIKEFHPEPCDYDEPFIYVCLKGERKRMTVRNIERIVKKYADRARETKPNLPDPVYPHMLRRTRATLWYREGVPIETIASLLGHENIETTRAHYAKPSMEMKRESSERMMAQYDAEEQEWPQDDEMLAEEIGIL